MTESESFTKAIDLIKFKSGITIEAIAEQLKVKRHIIDNIRRGTAPNEMLSQELIRLYPYVETFFTDSTDFTNEEIKSYSTKSQLEEVQKKMIELQEERIKELKERISTLKRENETLRNRIINK